MKVRATRDGYYGNVRVYEGNVFTLTDPAHFSDSENVDFPGWMEKVEVKEPPTASKPSKTKAEKKKKRGSRKAAAQEPPLDPQPSEGEPEEGEPEEEEGEPTGGEDKI